MNLHKNPPRLNYLTVKGIVLQILDADASGAWDWVGKEMNNDDYHLEEMNLGPDDVVIDIGANTGIFAIYIAKKFGCKVISFEPVPPTYDNLSNNIKLNGAEHLVTAHNCAITSVEGDVLPITYNETITASSSTWIDGEYWNCRTETIDKYVKDLKKIKLFKVDCEGGEYEVIPAIVPYMDKIENIAVEYHRYIDTQDPQALHRLIKANFKGNLIATMAPNRPVNW